jgi:hypothetical protein
MVSSTRSTIAVILIIFSGTVFARAQTVQTKEPTATITGKVTIKGKPASGIFIGLRLKDSNYNSAISFKAGTDNEGKYRIEKITAGTYTVVLVSPAYIFEDNVANKSLNISSGETIENVDFALVLGGAITGRVTDAEGNPRIEELVFAIPDFGYVRPHVTSMRAQTDDRGVYRIFGLAKGRYRVAAGADRAYSINSGVAFNKTFHPSVSNQAEATVIDLTEGGEASNVDIVLQSTLTTYSVSGRIVDGQTGEPISNANFSWSHYFEHGQSTTTMPGTSKNGEFSRGNFSPGKYSVSAQDPVSSEWRTNEVSFEIVDQDVTGLLIKSERAAAISGVVVLEGTDDKNAREQLGKLRLFANVQRQDNLRGRGADINFGPDGKFRASGLDEGIVVFSSALGTQLRMVRIERNGVVQTRGIEIKQGEQVAGVRIILQYANASIRGSITVENGPMPPGGRSFVWVRRVGESPNPAFMNSEGQPQLDARNQFLVEDLLPGTYEVVGGVTVPQARRNITKRLEVVVTAGSANNVTLTLDLSPRAPQP